MHQFIYNVIFDHMVHDGDVEMIQYQASGK